jgi:hypothetical protein
MARRRTKGEGTIWKSTKNGKTTWFAEVVVATDESGKRRLKRAQSSTQAEVLKRLGEHYGDAQAFLEAAGRITLGARKGGRRSQATKRRKRLAGRG